MLGASKLVWKTEGGEWNNFDFLAEGRVRPLADSFYQPPKGSRWDNPARLVPTAYFASCMIEIETNNRTGCRVPLKKIQALLDRANARLAARRKQRLSLAFVGVKTMQGLNRVYRKKDRPTDVLSFGNGGGFFGEDTIGEIIICPVVARAQAREHGQPIDAEICKLVLHGYLHLLGFDHEITKEAVRMERLENKILTQFYG